MLKTKKLLKLLQSQECPSLSRSYSYPPTFQKFLRRLPPVKCSTLENGLTVASEERACYNACVGLYIKAGARYETLFENGITHFFEHIAFKGTNARKKTVLEDQMSSIGAHFHCFTTREMVAFYAECLCEDLPLVVDILTDCVFNNGFSRPDITQQKKVVFSEMLHIDNDHYATLYDYLHSTAFQGTPLAQTVMGPSSNLYNFNECTISRYMRRVFDPKRTVLAAVGGVKHEQMMCLANSCLNNLVSSDCVESNKYRFTGSEIRFRDDTLPAANVAIAVEGPSFCDPDTVVMDVAATLVGGWDRSQQGGMDHPVRVAQCASSGHFCDSYKSFNITYTDTSLWGVQFLSSPLHLEDMLYTIQDEWMRLCSMVTDPEIERAKRQLKAKLLTVTESCREECHDIGRWMLFNGHRPTIHDRILSIDKVFAPEIKDACNRYVYDKCPVVAAVGPTEGLPDYTRIRAGMYWLRL